MSAHPSAPDVNHFHRSSPSPLPLVKVFQTWWPLAAGWLVMTAEIPLLAAFVARAADPEVHLAAWGLVFPMVLILASPVMMLLAASTALSRDWDSYRRMRRYMVALIVLLTALHGLLAFTPLFDAVIVGLISPPTEIVEPVRLGLRILLPWSLCLAYRRFNNGVLIRFGHPGVVTVGAMVRLASDLAALAILFLVGGMPGIVLASGSIICGVAGEAIYAGIRVQPVLRNELRRAPAVQTPLTLFSFLGFYLPLVMTSLLQIMVQPVATAALSRMPAPLESLAAWPVIYGIIIIFMSAGMAFVEASVVLLDEPHALGSVRRFAVTLGLSTASILTLLNVTPLAELWLRYISALPPDLIPIAKSSLWLGIPIPLLASMEAYFQGILLHTKRTRGITEAVLLGLLANGTVLVSGVLWGGMEGLYVGMMALSVGYVVRSLWFWHRTRAAVRIVQAEDRRTLEMASSPVATPAD